MCFDQADVVFVLDSSMSVTPEDFVKALNFCKKFLSQLSINNGDVRIGIVTFGSKYTIEFYLNEFTSKDQIDQAIDKIPWRNGRQINTAEGIRAMHQAMFTSLKGDRQNVPNIAIIITHGPSADTQSTLREAKAAKSKGIHIYAVNVDQDDTFSETISVASGPTGRNAFFIRSFAQLDGLEDEIISSAACPGTLARNMCLLLCYDVPCFTLCCECVFVCNFVYDIFH